MVLGALPDRPLQEAEAELAGPGLGLIQQGSSGVQFVTCKVTQVELMVFLMYLKGRLAL